MSVAKKKLSSKEINVITWSSLFALIILAVAFSVIFSALTKPKADYDGFKSAALTYLYDNNNISDIVIVERDIMKVIVKDIWYSSTEIEKLKFCNNVHDSIYAFAYQYNLIYEGNDYISVRFYDTTNIKVAYQDMGEFNILY